MVDLKGQYDKIKSEIDSAIQEVITTTAFINGPKVSEFGKNLEKYLNTKHVIPCANGTDALQVALMALDLKPGDEIITAPFTFVATVEVVALLGLKLVFADVDKDTYTITPEAIRKCITPRSKVIVPIHLFGQCADMDKIMEIAREHNLYVIEDNAQAIGANYRLKDGSIKKAGTIGHIGTTSFFPSKNLGCYGDGGAMYTNDDKLAEKMRMIINHGSKVKYYHETIGVNSRLDTIQAAILDVKLKYLDNYCANRQKVADFYDKKLSANDKIRIPGRNKQSDHVFHQYTFVCEKISRDLLKEKLDAAGIPNMIYYPVPLHMQSAYKNLGYKEGDFPVSEYLSRTVLSLPMHTEMDEEQLNFITSEVLRIINDL